MGKMKVSMLDLTKVHQLGCHLVPLWDKKLEFGKDQLLE